MSFNKPKYLLPNSLKNFRIAIKNLPIAKSLLLAGLLLMSIMYPGQNYFQTLIIHPGPITPTSTILGIATFPLSDGTQAPSLSAQSVVVLDVDSKVMMYTKNPEKSMFPASTTKIMTALTALDYYTDLQKTVTISNESQATGHKMELQSGEVITIENLIYGLLVESGNDAAFALANNYPGGYDSFITAMNKKAKDLRLYSTLYKNPSGIEQYGHVTSARDLAVLAVAAVNNPIINKVMQTKSITVTDITGEITHELSNTNELLGEVQGLKGIKTGWTQNAGECLVSYTERDGKKIITVVLNSQDRFGETKSLIKWAFQHHNWVKPEI